MLMNWSRVLHWNMHLHLLLAVVGLLFLLLVLHLLLAVPWVAMEATTKEGNFSLLFIHDFYLLTVFRTNKL